MHSEAARFPGTIDDKTDGKIAGLIVGLGSRLVFVFKILFNSSFMLFVPGVRIVILKYDLRVTNDKARIVQRGVESNISCICRKAVCFEHRLVCLRQNRLASGDQEKK